MADYAHPECPRLHRLGRSAPRRSRIKLVEVDVDTDGVRPRPHQGRDRLELADAAQRLVSAATSSTSEQFAELCRNAGISQPTRVVLYGDNNNWFAACALWQFKLHGHKDVRLMNGGRKKWVELENRETDDRPRRPSRHDLPRRIRRTTSLRAYRRDVADVARRGKANLVDVRSPDEFTGKVIAPPGMTETAQRGGHIPGATSIPWSKTVNDDGTFKSADELESALRRRGRRPQTSRSIAYCRIGERSSHSWFVLKYLLGYPNVRNYDGSWTEWGNMVGVPIEK